ncbi:hypothetical protein H0H81_002681 [Sphagnurus paluster]|uniref:Uncharacterized protein n=1 Tax=Sphagnurus paluster TaxID=117069 RepID=A0A9P7K6H7_9AGAR|nr:hypothetical protein H0H81_002681 [Sphagnurus paluster]
MAAPGKQIVLKKFARVHCNPSDLSISSLFNVKGKIGKSPRSIAVQGIYGGIVLVTGGGSGIGKMIAAGFAQNGAKVYIAARKVAQLKEAAEDISKGSPIPVQYIQANVGSRAGCEALITEFKKREDKLHVLVNNSGITWGGSYNDFPEEKGWDNVFNVNDANNQDPGRVINISSTASVDPRTESPLSKDGDGTWSCMFSHAGV